MSRAIGPGQQLASLVVVLALTGCSMIPTFERPAAPVAARYPAISASADTAGPAGSARSGGSPDPAGGTGSTGIGESATAAIAADIGWRDFIAETRLRQLVSLALANNRDLRVAMLNVEQSRAQYRITRAASFPSVDGNASLTRQHLQGLTSSQWTAGIGASAYELDLFGRVHSLNQQALEQFLATAEAQRSAQISLVAEVATQYFTLRETEEQLILARQTLSAVRESYDLNRISSEAGEISEQDVRTAEGQVDTAKLNVLTYELAVAQAQNALVLLVGQPLPEQLPQAAPFGASLTLADVPAGLPSDLVQRRPDILAAEHTLKAANANIGAARAAFFPRISLTGSIGTASSQLSQLFGAGSSEWNFSPQLTVPIFNAGQNRASLDAARIATRIEVANYEKAIQTAFREVADALVASNNYAAQIDTQSAAISAQQRRLELASLRYRQGEDSYLNVLSAQQDLYSAQRGRLEAQFNRFASQISLYRALGGGWR